MPRGDACLMLLALAACGDNVRPAGEPLQPATDLVIADDDLALFAPDLDAIIERRDGATVVFTATVPRPGALAALGGDQPWTCGWIDLVGHPAEHCRLDRLRLSAVFLDGDLEALGAIPTLVRPTTVRTTELVTATGAATLLALSEAHSDAALLAFRSASPRAAIGIRRTARGKLAVGDGCLDANSDGSVRHVPCDAAPVWTIAGRRLALDADHCMQTLPTEELVVGSCLDDPRGTYFLDDLGRLFTGTAPVARSDDAFAPLACLYPTGGRVRAHACTPDEPPTWTVAPPTVASGVAPTVRGRDVRIADVTGDGLGDLCQLATGLRCAPGRGDGTFGPATRVDTGLAIEASSLALGDVDGDRAIDACGHVASGILCALAGTGYAAAPWSTAFDAAATVDGTATSLAIVDGQLCGLAAGGVICVVQDGPTAPPPISPVLDGPVWITELASDGTPDWCTDDGGLVCNATPYSFATDAVGSTDATAFGDLDGDGFVDRCTFDGATLRCARGQGFGFGPLFAVPGLVGNPVIGDLDGDRVAELCDDTGTCVLPSGR